MKTYSVEHVLCKKLAYVPGTYSNIGRLILVVPLDPLPLSFNKSSTTINSSTSNSQQQNDINEQEDLALTLNFYAQIFRFNEILEFNVMVVIDNRSGNWRRLRPTLKLIKMFLPQVAVALVVKADQASTPLNVKLWLNRTRPITRSTFGNLCGSDTASVIDGSNAVHHGTTSTNIGHANVRPSTVLVVSQSKLGTYICDDQLPVEFGGHFLRYNHGMWLISRIAAERFIDRVEALISQRFMSDVEREKVANSHSIAEWKVRQLLDDKDQAYDVSRLMDLGRKVLENLKKQSCSKLNHDLVSSVQMAITSLEPITFLRSYYEKAKQQQLQQMKKQHRATPKVKICGSKQRLLSAEGQEFFVDRLEMEREINAIRRWLAHDGDRLIMCETDVGTSLKSAERLVDKHDMIEMDCAETFARYARLVSTLDLLCLTRPGERDLLMQKHELDSAVRVFAMRVDRRRTLLLTSARFFRLHKKSTAAVRSTARLLARAAGSENGAFLDEKQQISLATNKHRAEILGAKTFEEGARLVQMLRAGTGRPDVVRDYSKEIEIIISMSNELRNELEEMEEVFKTPSPGPEEPLEEQVEFEPVKNVEPKKEISKDESTDDDDNLEELIGIFIETLEQQLITVGHFVKTFSKELTASLPNDSRQILLKYQSTYYDLEHQWNLMNRCGLDFVGKIIQ